MIAFPKRKCRDNNIDHVGPVTLCIQMPQCMNRYLYPQTASPSELQNKFIVIIITIIVVVVVYLLSFKSYDGLPNW